MNIQSINKRKKPFYVERGDVYLADLGSEDDVTGSEQYGIRPVVCTQSNFLNRRSPTVIVAAVTSELKKADLDTHVLLPHLAGLPMDSMVLCEQRRTIDKQRLIKYCCKLPSDVMEDVTRACRIAERGERTKCRKASNRNRTWKSGR